MDHDHCPEEEVLIRKILTDSKRIAIVGMSDKHTRPSNRIGKYLISQGYEVVPVNPNYQEVEGLQCHPSLEAAGQIDVAVVFMNPDRVVPIAEAAVKTRVPILWFQEGVVNEDAIAIAKNAGLTVIFDKCIMKEHYTHMA